jgi:hypothetical protein
MADQPDEYVFETLALIQLQLSDCAGGKNLATVDYRNPGTEPFSDFKNVTTKENRPPFSDVIQQPLAAFALVDWVEVGKWLIEEI